MTPEPDALAVQEPPDDVPDGPVVCLDLRPLTLEVSQAGTLSADALALAETLTGWLPRLWPPFWALALAEGLPQSLGLTSTQPWSLELLWCDDAVIQGLNAEHRGKDAPTDVLSFPLWTPDAPLPSLPPDVDPDGGPEVSLGSIVISLDWALAHARQEADPAADPAQLSGPAPVVIEGVTPEVTYTLERVIHGMFHILGVTHDTLPDYHRVIRWQRQVLHGCFTAP